MNIDLIAAKVPANGDNTHLMGLTKSRKKKRTIFKPDALNSAHFFSDS
jgi:hypothetical protein